MTQSRRRLSTFALAMLIISAVDSNRNLPASALFGSPLIFFFLFAAVFFLFPSSLVAAELSAAFPEEGGVYHWVRSAFGKKMGLIAVWLQWINTVVWYPTVLTFIAGTLTYLISPSLLESKLYMSIAISSIFWILTFLNIFGIQTSARINAFFALIGTIFPMLLLIALGIFWLLQNHPSQISFSPQAIFPTLGKLDTWTALQAVMGSFLGMELSGVHVNEVPHPQKTFPKALLLSAIYILATMLFGSLAIAVVLPGDKINLAGGIMQVFSSFFEAFHLQKFSLLMAILIVLGSFGGMINWLISPAKGLLQSATSNLLPSFFAKTNKNQTPTNILFFQSILVTCFCFLFFLLPSINAFYWFLTALSNSLYMGMYILMFLSVYKLRSKTVQSAFKIPGGKMGLCITSLFGLIGAVLTIFFGFIPPAHIDVGSYSRYVLMILSGNALLILPALFLLRKKGKKNRKTD